MRGYYSKQATAYFNVQPNPLIDEFFSDANINVLQSALKKSVKQRTGHAISNQSCDEIATVMRYIYINSGRPLTKNANIRAEVDNLNSAVLSDLVPMVSSNVMQYVQYTKDISTLRTPINHGVSTSTKGNNTLKLQDPF